MSDFIEREVVLNWMYELIEARQAWTSDARGEIQGLNAAVCAIEDIPAADVAPVRHGCWKPRDLTWGRSYYYCTICEETVDMPTAMGIPMFKFCPNCGALMDKDGDGDG